MSTEQDPSEGFDPSTDLPGEMEGPQDGGPLMHAFPQVFLVGTDYVEAFLSELNRTEPVEGVRSIFEKST